MSRTLQLVNESAVGENVAVFLKEEVAAFRIFPLFLLGVLLRVDASDHLRVFFPLRLYLEMV